MITPSSLAGNEWRLSLPLVFFFGAFFIAPLAIMFAISLFTSPQLDLLGVDQYVLFLTDSFNLKILWDTIWLGMMTTIACAIFGYPIAYLYTRVSRLWQTIMMFLIVLPLLTSSVVRTFAWIVILGREGIINTVLQEIGLISLPMRLLYTEPGLVAALAQIWMPLMVLPVVNALLKIDPALTEASAALGAGTWRTFFRVTLPLSLPGLVAGSLLVFTASATAFVVQSVIGGGRRMFMPLYIYQQATGLQNWPFAAAVSIIFLLGILLMLVLFDRLGRASHAFSGR